MSRPKTTISLLHVPPRDSSELVKAGDLIDISGVQTLSRSDRLMFNLLLKNAHGEALGRPGASFEIDLAELQDTHDSNDRIVESVKKLMGVVVKIEGDASWDEEGLGLTQLLGDCDISSPTRVRGRMRYTFPPKMARLLKDATIYTRLQADVMRAFRSKYALVLYEMVSKRIRLQKTQEIFTIDDFRDVMGVPDGKLTDWSNLRKFCVEPAVSEVTQLAPFWTGIIPRKTGRTTTHLVLSWGDKDESARIEAQRELSRHSAGRKARRDGGVDRVLE